MSGLLKKRRRRLDVSQTRKSLVKEKFYEVEKLIFASVGGT